MEGKKAGRPMLTPEKFRGKQRNRVKGEMFLSFIMSRKKVE